MNLPQIQFQVTPDLLNFEPMLVMFETMLIIVIKFRPRAETEFNSTSVPGEAVFA